MASVLKGPAGGVPTRATMLVGAMLLAALAGCTSGSAALGSSGNTGRSTPPAASSTPTTQLPTTRPPTTQPPSADSTASVTRTSGRSQSPVTRTVIETKPGQTVTVGPPAPTAEPAAIPGECPYLSADVVSFITGQHHGQTQLVSLSPQPMCVFYRSDGGWMGSIRVIKAANPLAAVAAVNQHVPIAGSQPASQPAGWSGGLMSTPGQMTQDSDAKSVYAVSKGDIAIVAEEDDSPSIKARVMAVCAIYGLKLEAGRAPAACSGAEG